MEFRNARPSAHPIEPSQLARVLDVPPGIHDVACPVCGPGRRAPLNRRRQVLRIWRDQPGILTYHCARCGIDGWSRAGETPRISPDRLARLRAEARERDAEDVAHRLQAALRLWDASVPAAGTFAETYLRSRSIEFAALPATIRYLPPLRPEHHPAMIASFALPHEPEPGQLAVPREAIRGVHLTFLRSDGRGKAAVEPAKIMVGRSMGTPIVVAPIGEGLGLTIAEGIEDAAAAHVMTGLGAWAAGSAGRMPTLADAVPTYTETVTIIADDDDAGRHGAEGLAEQLAARGIEVTLATAELRRAVV